MSKLYVRLPGLDPEGLFTGALQAEGLNRAAQAVSRGESMRGGYPRSLEGVWSPLEFFLKYMSLRMYFKPF